MVLFLRNLFSAVIEVFLQMSENFERLKSWKIWWRMCFSEKKRSHRFKRLLYMNGKAQNLLVVAGPSVNLSNHGVATTKFECLDITWTSELFYHLTSEVQLKLMRRVLNVLRVTSVRSQLRSNIGQLIYIIGQFGTPELLIEVQAYSWHLLRKDTMYPIQLQFTK